MTMILIENKRARFDYEIVQTYQAGIVLSGPEVKSLRQKQASLKGAFVQILASGQPILLNSQITPYKYADNRNYDPQQTRLLLLKKKQIYQIQAGLSQKGYTVVPLAFILVGAFIKLEIGLGRGKKQFEKRAKIKSRDLAREARREATF